MDVILNTSRNETNINNILKFLLETVYPTYTGVFGERMMETRICGEAYNVAIQP